MEPAQGFTGTGTPLVKTQAPTPAAPPALDWARYQPRAAGRDLLPGRASGSNRGADRSRTPHQQPARPVASPPQRSRAAPEARSDTAGVDERSFLRIIEDVPLFSREQCRLLYGAL